MIAPLRYNISNWNQLPDCLSNTSQKLHIRVSEIIQSDILNGTRISIIHEDYGYLFTCIVNVRGRLVSASLDNVIQFTPERILAELEKFGFFVTYNPEEHLDGDQLQFLMTLDDLHMDKIRIMNVWSNSIIDKSSNYKVVAFDSDKNPEWLSAGYRASLSEFNRSINDGTVIDVSAISKKESYDWSWLFNKVLNISDILKDNSWR